MGAARPPPVQARMERGGRSRRSSVVVGDDPGAAPDACRALGSGGVHGASVSAMATPQQQLSQWWRLTVPCSQ